MPPPAKPTQAGGIDLEVLDKMLAFLRGIRGYTRLKVDGLEHVPQEGPALLAANHTGWLGLDYALTALVLHDEVHRIPRGMVHQAWFMAPQTAQFAAQVGLTKVSKESMTDGLRAGNLVVVFPEGEKGAFRAGTDYQLSEFARGFVRVAMEEHVPIVPVAILGGEESNPVDRTIDSYEALLKMPIPVPRNLIPKPVKWRIRFLPPVEVGGGDPGDHDEVHAVSKGVRDSIQKVLDQLKVERGHPYF